MLKFKLINVVFFLFALLFAWCAFNVFYWILLLILYAAIITYGSAKVNSGFFLKAFCRGDKTKKQFTLTFDDGPDPVNTPLLLDLLKKANVSATFFCIGEKLEKHPEVAAGIFKEGHIIGNHSYSHTNRFPLKSVKQIRGEILKTREIIENITGQPNIFFRPPFGVTNPRIARATKGLGFTITGWSLRSFDLSGNKSDKIASRVISKLRGGDIILLHDTSPDILRILGRLLSFAESSDYEIINLDEMLTGIKNDK